MDESPRKVEHAKVPAASADPAADLALVKRLRTFAKAQDHMAAQASEDRAHWHHVSVRNQLDGAADAIERLLRERDAAQAHIVRLRHAKSLEIRRAEIAEAERDAALRERDELMRRLNKESGSA